MGRFAGLIGFGLSIRRTVTTSATVQSSGVSVYKSADDTSANYSAGPAITFNTELYDDGTWHDTGANTSRITIPSGVAYVQALGQVQYANNAALGAFTLSIKKDGNLLSSSFIERDTDTSGVASLLTGPIPVVQGNYLELCWTAVSDASSDVLAAGTHFSVWKVG
jgi:hypothetical protein